MDTEIYLQSEDQDYITQEALRFSRAYDIVNSDLWANLMEEKGIRGLVITEEIREKISKSKKGQRLGYKHSEDTKQKMSKSGKVVIHTKEWCENMSKARKGIPQPNISKAKKGISVPKISEVKSKKWIVVDPSGKSKEIINLYKFCKENGLVTGSMFNVAKGKQDHHRGWKCSRND